MMGRKEKVDSGFKDGHVFVVSIYLNFLGGISIFYSTWISSKIYSQMVVNSCDLPW